MNTSLKLKISALIFVVALSIVTLIPSFYSSTPDWWQKYMAPEGLRLGLDLQGGIHVILKVNLDKAEEDSLKLAANELKDLLQEQGISAVLTKSEKDTVLFTLPNASSIDTVTQVAKDKIPEINVRIEAKEGSFPKIYVSLKSSEIDFIRTHAVEQSLEIIRNRIDEFGVSEPVIIRQGESEIVVQLAGIDDPKRAIDLIGKTAQLEFKKVVDVAGINIPMLAEESRIAEQWDGNWKDKKELAKLNRALQNRLPEGTRIYIEKDRDQKTGKEIIRPILLYNQILMTGEMVKNSQVQFSNQFNEPQVGMEFTSKGGRVFAKITGANVGKRMAIVLDDVVRSAPVIRDKIVGGSAQISGDFTIDEARDLAIVLRVGALPAPVDIIQNMTVGASLGQDSIDKGMTSGIFGALIVLVFMAIYYRLSGIIANMALILNILFLFTGLAILNATLTLPGIAGIILSIGMAVDANVLIFERMREEYDLGKSVKSSVDGGFGKAFWTIVDSQVTTLITAMALFMFGTGPIKGFAITLSLGIIFNLFTALFCSRLMFDALYSMKGLKKLTFMQFIKKPNIDFMQIRKITFALSGIFVLVGLIAFVQITRGKANLGVDFSGGSLLQYKAKTEFTMDEVRSVFEANGLKNANLQKVEGEHRLIIKIRKSEEIIHDLSDQISTLLSTEMPGKGFVLESQSDIGSSVSAVLRNKAIQAIFISLIGVIIYLAMRFDIRFGLAAAVATFHDVIVVLGICWLLDVEITLLIVTALLTLAGYSLNDSVVVFDRIRENMQKSEDHSLLQQINRSINEVMSRTFVTSLTTAMTLLSLFLFGGSVIHDFALALLLGVVVGTYSSIFIASPIVTLWPAKKNA
jgi:SecD/SecF fusion protein